MLLFVLLLALMGNSQALNVESAFVAKAKAYTVIPEGVTSPSFKASIANNWQISLSAPVSGQISNLALIIDGFIIAKTSNLSLKPQQTVNYLFADKELRQVINAIAQGYKYLGAYQQITAGNFIGFSDFKVRKLQLRISWSDAAKNYHQDYLNFLLVFAK